MFLKTRLHTVAGFPVAVSTTLRPIISLPKLAFLNIRSFISGSAMKHRSPRITLTGENISVLGTIRYSTLKFFPEISTAMLMINMRFQSII